MPEIGTYGSMSGDGKRGDAAWPKLPRPSSTLPFRPLWPDRGLADSLLSTDLKDCASTRLRQIGAREVYRAVLAAAHFKPHSCDCTNFGDWLNGPRARYIASTRSLSPPHFKPTNRAPRPDIPRSRQSPAPNLRAIGRCSLIALGVGSA